MTAPNGVCRPGWYCVSRATTPMPLDGVTGDICPAGYECPNGTDTFLDCKPGTYRYLQYLVCGFEKWIFFLSLFFSLLNFLKTITIACLNISYLQYITCLKMHMYYTYNKLPTVQYLQQLTYNMLIIMN